MGDATPSELSRVHLRRASRYCWPRLELYQDYYAYTTLKRVSEIGIRVALGARPAQIRALILSHGLQLLLIGSVIGLIATFCPFAHVAKRAFRSQRDRSKNLSWRWAYTVRRHAGGGLDHSAALHASTQLWRCARNSSRFTSMRLTYRRKRG